MSFATDQIRNIAIAGHGSTGKTTLLEHILFQGGVISKPETIESGKTVSDFGEDEIARKISVRSTLTHCTVRDTKINFIDTPGSSDFVGEVILAFRACESALILIDARSGVQIETIKLWRNLDSRSKPRMVFVSRMDEERASYSFGARGHQGKIQGFARSRNHSHGEGLECTGVIDIINQKAYLKPASGDQKETASAVPAEYKDAVESARLQLFEAAAEGDDELMEKYLLDGQLSQEDTITGSPRSSHSGEAGSFRHSPDRD